ncbi:hypothetical protein DFH29DRAFT_348163 [Suillus ampliporus]|nr:hypothetical protein DFH29DRAFT_348163 [Suillus ampliporus]
MMLMLCACLPRRCGASMTGELGPTSSLLSSPPSSSSQSNDEISILLDIEERVVVRVHYLFTPDRIISDQKNHIIIQSNFVQRDIATRPNEDHEQSPPRTHRTQVPSLLFSIFSPFMTVSRS